MPHKKGRKQKQRSFDEPEALKKAPHTFVAKRGRIGKNVGQLLRDFRRIMEPYTATNLKIRKQNVIRDYVSVASLLNVTHLVMYTKTDKAAYMRLCRLPRGPTLTYKICEYSLTADVLAAQRKPLIYSGLFQLSPLIIMNQFAGGDSLELKLSASMWRNAFPSIDINKTNLNSIRRCVLLNYNPETKLIDLRHYAIRVKPVGLSRTVRKLITSRKVPDLGKFGQIDDVMGREAALTESEGEAADEFEQSRHVTLPQSISSRGNLVNERSAVQLRELGPRMTLELVKIEEGLVGGRPGSSQVLFYNKPAVRKAKARQHQAASE